jgi:hypothetical protein
MNRSLSAVLVLAVAGCAQRGTDGIHPANSQPGKSPNSNEDSVVKAYVLDHADDPESVEFDRFGPDDLEGWLPTEIRKQSSGGIGVNYVILEKSDKIVRVRYRSKNRAGAKQLHDELYGLKDGKVIPSSWTGIIPTATPNYDGDEWLANYKKNRKPEPPSAAP